MINHPDQLYREITLTRGYTALVDSEDYERVAAHKWTAMPCKSGQVYARRTVKTANGKCHTVLLHRFILGEPPYKVDHRDRNGLNCQKRNLREATNSQNQCNRRSRRPSKLGFIGLQRTASGKCRGKVKILGQAHYTKPFRSPAEAAAARDALARVMHGEFAMLNFPVTTGVNA